MNTTPSPASPSTAPQNKPAEKQFTLGKGALFVGVSKTALRQAIERGEVTSGTTDRGHYQIPISQLIKYRNRREEAEQFTENVTVNSPESVPVNSGESAPQNRGEDQGEVHRDRGEPLIPLRYHEKLIEQLTQQYSQTITHLRHDIQVWQHQVERTEERHQKLLTDQRETDTRSRAGRTSGKFRKLIWLLLLLGGVIGFWLFRDVIVEIGFKMFLTLFQFVNELLITADDGR